MSALYRGVEPAVIGTVASQAVYNYFYSAMRNRYVAERRTPPGPLSNLAIASAAGCVNVMCTIPIWTVTTRMQAARKKADGDVVKLKLKKVAIARVVVVVLDQGQRRDERRGGCW